MVVRRTNNGEHGLTAGAWLEDRTTTTYQPSHLRVGVTARRTVAPPPPPPFTARRLAPAMAGARVPPAPSMFAHSASGARRTLALDDNNPFARPRGAVGTSFWNALAFAGLFASVLIGRVIVQAGQEGTRASTPQAAATPTSAVAPTPPSAAPVEGAQAPQNGSTGGVGASPLAAAELQEPTQHEPALQPSAADANPRSKSAESSTPMHRTRAARARHESLDWRQEAQSQDARSEVFEPLSAAMPQAASPAVSLGTLRINSRPWSQVFIDGRLVGNTPQLGVRLPAGRYSVRLANPELGMTKTIVVSLAAGELVSRVELLEEP